MSTFHRTVTCDDLFGSVRMIIFAKLFYGPLRILMFWTGESPLEIMTSSIVSKIRFVARDEQLFSFVLCMPVPQQLYFAKWIRLMFGREVAGGIKSVMHLWDAFFDLASARTSVEEIPISIALLDVLKAA